MEAKRTWHIPEIGKIEAKKNELGRSKTNRGGIGGPIRQTLFPLGS